MKRICPQATAASNSSSVYDGISARMMSIASARVYGKSAGMRRIISRSASRQ